VGHVTNPGQEGQPGFVTRCANARPEIREREERRRERGEHDLTLAAEIANAARQDRPAASLLVPYLAWSLYATALTAAVSPDGATDITG